MWRTWQVQNWRADQNRNSSFKEISVYFQRDAHICGKNFGPEISTHNVNASTAWSMLNSYTSDVVSIIFILTGKFHSAELLSVGSRLSSSLTYQQHLTQTIMRFSEADSHWTQWQKIDVFQFLCSRTSSRTCAYGDYFLPQFTKKFMFVMTIFVHNFSKSLHSKRLRKDLQLHIWMVASTFG